LFLLVPSLVSADLFDTARQAIRTDVGRADSSGVSVRGGAAITSGVTATSVPLLRGQLTTGGGCGAFSFATSLTQVFEEVPELLEALAQQLANNLPMLVLSYACPTCVDLVKHVQALSNVLVNARFAQCQAMTAAAQYGGMRLRGGEISQCLSDEVAAGHGISAALRTCNGDVTDVRSPTGRRAPRVEVLAETLDAAGASPETRTLAKSLLGELTMSANGGQLGTQQDRPSAGMLARYEANRLAADTALRTAIEELKTTGQVSDATLRAVSVPGQPLPRAALDALVALQQDPTRYETLLGKLSTGLAVTQLTWECDDLKSQLAGSIESNQELTDEQRRLLERRLEALERDLKQVIAKKDIVEKHLQPALDALLQEYQAVQSVATQAGFRAPAKVGPVMPYRTQGPGGYGQ
jgi:regulator of replication initiation timing